MNRGVLYIDDREPGEVKAKAPSDATIMRLDYGDYWLVTPERTVGIERKTPSDLCSSITDARLDRQLQELVKLVDIPILLIHGDLNVWLKGRYGKSWDIHRLWNKLATYQELGVRLQYAHAGADALLERLDSLRTYYARDIHALRQPTGIAVQESHLSPLVRALMQLPGIGTDRAKALAAHFGSLRALLAASEQELGAVEGIGKKTIRNLMISFG